MSNEVSFGNGVVIVSLCKFPVGQTVLELSVISDLDDWPPEFEYLLEVAIFYT